MMGNVTCHLINQPNEVVFSGLKESPKPPAVDYNTHLIKIILTCCEGRTSQQLNYLTQRCPILEGQHPAEFSSNTCPEVPSKP